ncbi:MAG: hypothetical protein AB7W16_22280 [Candidatus Obscuribacterales bacterium]
MGVAIPDRKILEGLLDEQFSEPASRYFFGLFQRGPVEIASSIEDIEPFEDGGFFERNRLFTIRARDVRLEGACLPAGGTYGVFAYDGQRLLYLQGNPKTRAERLGELLASEGKPLDSGDPARLASLFFECLYREGNDSHELIPSEEALLSYQQLEFPYEVNKKELPKVSERLKPPAIVDDGVHGWRISALSVHGWMHRKTTLSETDIAVSRDFKVTHRQTALSKAIFSSTPGLRY